MMDTIRRLLRGSDDPRWFEDWQLASRWDDLARYNSEVSHGIVHTPEWVARMEADQTAFNSETSEQREARYAASRRIRYPG